jgi:SPP1 family predicted phage head-tail adaptor
MGGISQDYSDYKTVWCSIDPLTGTEKTIAAQRGSEENVRITMRYDSGVNPACRLRKGDSTTYFDITNMVNPEFRNKELILYCRMEQ